MPPAPIPVNERYRLAAIRSNPALDGSRDFWNDECAKIASAIAGCPIAIVSIVEEHRQWFRGCHGLAVNSTPRDAAFCSYTILGKGPLIVPDALRDPRFRDNPLVLGEPRIRFYAGMPLIDEDGMALGSLCVIHTEPHEIGAEQLWALRSLSRLALDNLTQRRAVDDARCSLAAMTAEREALIATRGQLEAEIARRDRLVHELEETARRAEAATAAKSAFIANMSHEVRTPMTAILGYADLLAGEDGEPLDRATRAEAVDSIQRNGQHLLRIINDLLDVSRIEAGKLEIERLPTPVRVMVDQVAATLRGSVALPDVEVVVEHAAGVPEEVMTDPTRLRQILLNLIGNALKFTSEGSVSIRTMMLGMTIDSTRSPSLRIDVVDTGIGMDEEQRSGLFQPFSQADASHTRVYGGTGLGLCISAQLARLMGGDIRVWSERGKGSHFSLTIPVEVCGAGVASGPEAGAGVVGPPAVALDGQRILLVEDGLDNQRLVAFHLGRAGAVVEVAGDGVDGVRAVLEAEAAGEPFALVLMDIQMPRLDGYGATKELRAAGVATPIIALTAHAMSGERERCLAAGFDDYLTKPIDRSALLSACGRWIAGRGPGMGLGMGPGMGLGMDLGMDLGRGAA